SDTTATLPPNSALAAGTQSFAVTFNTNGNFTVTASDVTDGSKTANTSSSIPVNSSQITQATGGSAIPADNAGGTFVTLTGPSYTENASGDVGSGTIVLNAPSGFIFDTGGTAPTVAITRITSGAGPKSDLSGSITAVTATQIVFTVTVTDQNVTDKLTWQNVRLRPTSG